MADTLQAPGSVSEVKTVDELQLLINKPLGIKSEADPRGMVVKQALTTLAEQALQETALVSDDVVETIEAIIAEIDRKLSSQVNLILHHEDFQQIEAAWRGLHHLVNHTETDEKLKLKVLNVSKVELRKTFKKYQGASWDQSPIFKKIYGEEFDMLGGHPYGCITGDYYFDHSAPDVSILQGMAQVAAAAHAPLITSAGPSVLGMESWQDLDKPRDLTKIFQTPEYAAWKSFRDSEDAKYVGLCLPRFLGRTPYGAKTNPVDEFAFEEECDGGQHDKYCWANAAYAMATNITRSFKLTGWCASIRGVEGGGSVEGLPVHTFPTDDGGVDMKCPTEIAIGDRREAELAKNGFMPLLHRKNTDVAAFIGAQSLQKPAEYDDPDATANANLSARLPYLFATCRFSHYLKCMVRDWVGKFTDATTLESELQKWISNYVITDPTASQEMKAKYPLAEADVKVEENPSNPGYYNAVFWLKPHYQLEGLTASLRLVTKLPKNKGQ